MGLFSDYLMERGVKHPSPSGDCLVLARMCIKTQIVLEKWCFIYIVFLSFSLSGIIMSFKKEKSSALLPCQEQKCLENTHHVALWESKSDNALKILKRCLKTISASTVEGLPPGLRSSPSPGARQQPGRWVHSLDKHHTYSLSTILSHGHKGGLRYTICTFCWIKENLLLKKQYFQPAKRWTRCLSGLCLRNLCNTDPVAHGARAECQDLTDMYAGNWLQILCENSTHSYLSQLSSCNMCFSKFFFTFIWMSLLFFIYFGQWG